MVFCNHIGGKRLYCIIFPDSLLNILRYTEINPIWELLRGQFLFLYFAVRRFLQFCGLPKVSIYNIAASVSLTVNSAFFTSTLSEVSPSE